MDISLSRVMMNVVSGDQIDVCSCHEPFAGQVHMYKYHYNAVILMVREHYLNRPPSSPSGWAKELYTTSVVFNLEALLC